MYYANRLLSTKVIQIKIPPHLFEGRYVVAIATIVDNKAHEHVLGGILLSSKHNYM